ncbi:MAG: phosphoribosylformylglycinamidine synthase, partial [Christensenellaceae bacterium]|nr:phosphoribosylformylglycinamidine synthase [Christensenellaceae bacterium]
LTVVAPDNPLAEGLVDYLEEKGFRAFGPHKNAAILEASKIFSKELMKKYGIPTARYESFSDISKAKEYVKNVKYPLVVKADGLALGKGVIICQTAAEADTALTGIMELGAFGKDNNKVVIEEFLVGREVTLLAFTDGKTVKTMPSSQDHKRAFDGDKGLNTGGMGAFAPSPFFTAEIEEKTLEKIVTPTINALIAEGRPFKGVLYFGLMLVEGEPFVIEYNARFGDPEAQAVLPLLESDLYDIFNACVDGTLDKIDIKWENARAVTVVMAAKGYPEKYEKGHQIIIGDVKDATVYHAGTLKKDEKLITNGGRVLAVTAKAETIALARRKAYDAVGNISWNGAFFRSDIALSVDEPNAVRRIYVEKKFGFKVQAKRIGDDIKENLDVPVSDLRYFIRYDVQGVSTRDFEKAVKGIFAEPPSDRVYFETLPVLKGYDTFAIRYLKGQYDQRADSAAQCVQLSTGGARPLVQTASVYAIKSDAIYDVEKVKKYLINPTDSEETSISYKPVTLEESFEDNNDIVVLTGFNSKTERDLTAYHAEKGFAMTVKDLQFVQKYFIDSEWRDPTETELKVIDTYWSDHCRHTTFLTELTNVDTGNNGALKGAYELYLEIFKDLYKNRPEKYVCLMDIATIGTKAIKKNPAFENNLDESDEINACSIKIKAVVDGYDEDYLVMFKNETHNHPTEIEPFGGAATCLGGAIRDPLSGRVYVYNAMRITGAGDIYKPVSETMPGKLPQKVISKTAAAGFSSYGNQIGLATGEVHEVYHENYAAKRLETGFVVGAAHAKAVRREKPVAGDVIILLGGETGRDGIGGATGSSKAHSAKSVDECGAEVQKGNAPTERKIQRFFRNTAASTLIKKCNDFGAGGVCVAIGELADGLDIYLDKIPKKYKGLSVTETAVSESQERMAVVVAATDAAQFIKLAKEENLLACVVATVTDKARLRMLNKDGKAAADISREFLDTNGVKQTASVRCREYKTYGLFRAYDTNTKAMLKTKNFNLALRAVLEDKNVVLQKGLSEIFDSSIGAASVFMPWGGSSQLTPALVSAAKLPVGNGAFTKTASVSAWAFNPYITDANPYLGAQYAVATSVIKLAAAGVPYKKARLSLQEFFKRLNGNPTRFGEPFAALLGALKAQIGLNIPAIGGKDSMSGSFEEIDVPNTLISFALACEESDKLISNVFVENDKIYRFPVPTENGEINFEKLKRLLDALNAGIRNKKVTAATVVEAGGAIAAVIKSALGNKLGVTFTRALTEYDFEARSGDIIVASKSAILSEFEGEEIALAVAEPIISAPGMSPLGLETAISLLQKHAKIFPWEKNNFDKVFNADKFNIVVKEPLTVVTKAPKPRVFIPVFPGTNCEYDSEKAFVREGAGSNVFVVKNASAQDIEDSVNAIVKSINNSQIVMFPGGFSGGDEPDGSGKFIAATFRNPFIADAIHNLLYKRGGLILGICNGFQALIKLGLVPYGRIAEVKEGAPTLTFNKINRHVSTVVDIRIASNNSPWLSSFKTGEIYSVPVSHGEGRFVANEGDLHKMLERGQVATQYASPSGAATDKAPYNPNGSTLAIEGILSPNGQVFGKMGHTERYQSGIYKNIEGNFDMNIFKNGVNYFK